MKDPTKRDVIAAIENSTPDYSPKVGQDYIVIGLRCYYARRAVAKAQGLPRFMVSADYARSVLLRLGFGVCQVTGRGEVSMRAVRECTSMRVVEDMGK